MFEGCGRVPEPGKVVQVGCGGICVYVGLGLEGVHLVVVLVAGLVVAVAVNVTGDVEFAGAVEGGLNGELAELDGFQGFVAGEVAEHSLAEVGRQDQLSHRFGDERLDPVGADGGLVAGILALDAGSAAVVADAFVHRDRAHPEAASGAVEDAAQGVDAGAAIGRPAVDGLAPAAPEVLALLVEFHRHQRLVAALGNDDGLAAALAGSGVAAIVFDQTGVERTGEHILGRGLDEGLGALGPLAVLAAIVAGVERDQAAVGRLEAVFVELGGDVAVTELAAAVPPESQADGFTEDGVGDENLAVTAVGLTGVGAVAGAVGVLALFATAVAVAGGSSAVPQAFLGLLHLALAGLGGQVEGVPVSDDFQDALDQETESAIRVFGGFGSREDEQAEFLAQEGLVGDGVPAVAGQAQRFLETLMGRPLSPAQVTQVAALNRLVDGLPLAWSLLTPWLRGVADWGLVEEVLAESPLRALSRVERCFAAAYERLPEDVQASVRALAVFADAPFSAEALGAVLDVSTGEATRRVATLKAAAWLRESPLSPPETSYRLHRLLHRYAVKQAEDDPQHETYAERHARFYAQRAAPLLERQHEADWPDVVRQLLPDLPNFYRGQAWAAAKQHPLVMDYFMRLAPYFSAFREEERWQEWAEAAREVVKEAPSAFPAINRFSLYSQLGWGEGTFEQRLAYLQRAHEIATTETEPWVSVYSLTDLARLYLEPGQLVEAETALLEAWRVAQASEKPYLQAWTLREIGLYYARTLNREGCAVIADRLAEDVSQGLEGAYDAASRGEVLACAGRWAEALTAFREALTVYEAAGSRVQGSEMRLQVACCLAHLDREKEARDEIAAVEAHLDELPPEVVSLCRFAAGEAARLRGEHQTAVEHLSAALEPTGEGATFGWRVEFDVWLNLGQALQALGQEDKAENAFASAKVLAVNGHQPFWLWEVKRCHLIYERSPGPPSQVSELMSILHSE